MADKIIYITQKEYEDAVRQGKAVVDFYSTECPPCEALAAKFEPLSGLYGDDVRFYKIFRQENRELALSLGITSSPTLLFYDGGKLTGDKLSGGIKRSDIVKNLNALVGKERAGEIESSIKPVKTSCDIMIIGGGPAGLAAAIYSAQAKLNTIVVDSALPGGQVSTTHLVSNYPGFIKPQEGFMLSHFMSEQAKEAGAEFRSAVDISSVDLYKKEIVVDGYETISAKKIIVATGSSSRPLNIEGEKEYKGSGISYCATCDAKYYEGAEVIVVGGGNSAIEEALFISKFATKITVIHQFAVLQANKTAQERVFSDPKISFLLEHEPRAFIKNSRGGMTVRAENLKTGTIREVEADGVFVFVGMKPNIGIFGSVFRLDEWGYIEVDRDMRTSIKDVFAAGDVAAKNYRQITIAVSEGTIASITAIRDIEAGR